MLLLSPNRVVATSRLIDAVWEARPPARALSQLHACVSRLRGNLAAGGLPRDAVATAPAGAGYSIDASPETLDSLEFARLVSQARAGGTPPALARRCYRQALALWRGPALGGVGSTTIRQLAAVLDEQRLRAQLDLLDLELGLGLAAEALPELTDLAAQHPYHEPLHRLLMLALYRAGRQAEATEVYRRYNRALREEIGTEVGEELRRLHQAILQRDSSLDLAPVGLARWLPHEPPAHAAAAGAPRQLPPDIATFVGRWAQLDRLDTLLPASGDPAGPVVPVATIAGPAGVGKTALAVHWAHRMADQFPDGQLFLDLHGFTEAVPPVEPADALDRLLRALGVAGERIPADVEDRAGLWRSVLAGKRMLILLDNAAAEAQVAPLLPGTSRCLVVVTSRRRMAGLDAARPVPVDVLPLTDAVTLFTRTVGEEYAATGAPELVVEVVRLCAQLPLAIRIAAARLLSHPTWRVSHLLERLRDQQNRLGELAAGQRSVTAALDLSYQHLGPDLRRTYRLLGLHPGPEFDAYVTAALLDSAVLPAARLLDQLLEAHLLQEPAPGRYRFHDLTRAHAVHTARDQATPTSDAALGRLLDYFRHTASAAMNVAYPYERQHRPQVPPARTPSPDLIDPATAQAWLDTELPNLLAAARSATEHGRPVHTLQLSTILHSHLRARGPYRDAVTLHRLALAAAVATGDQSGQMAALNDLGDIDQVQGRYGQAANSYQQALRIARTGGNHPAELTALGGLGHIRRLQGRYGQAAEYFEQALRIAGTAGDHPAELTALNGLGHIHRMQGRLGQAAEYFEQALRIARTAGNRPAELTALNGAGQVHLRKGRYPQAIEHHRQALRIARATGNHPAELTALGCLGHIHLLQGRHEPAADHLEQALRIARATGHRPGELNALRGLGDTQRLRGRHKSAADHYQRLLGFAQESGDRNMEFEARQGLGRLSLATGDPDAAVAHHEHALSLAGELSQPEDQARALDGLARARHALDQYEPARRHWQEALDILTRLGTDNTDDEETTTAAIRVHLAGLDRR